MTTKTVIEQERTAFKKHYEKLFDLTETPDAWGNPKFFNEFVDAIWHGWKDRAALQSQDREGAERYRWLREHGFNHADVELTSDLDGNPITIWRLRFYIPEPSSLPYEDDEWTLEQLDEAIDHARRVEGGGE